ncbi:MAG: hypothetical protein ACXVNO_05045 [Bacteroidia bacterium]
MGLISASDVATIMVRLAEEKQYANRYILVEGNYNFKFLFDHIQQDLKKRKPFVNASRGLLNLGRIADAIVSKINGREPALTKSIINSALNKQQLSNKKIKNTLNFSFEPIEEVINQICGWYLLEHEK